MEVPWIFADDIVVKMKGGAISTVVGFAQRWGLLSWRYTLCGRLCACLSICLGSYKRPRLEPHGKPSRRATQAEAISRVSGSLTSLKVRQQLTDIEFARTNIECNLFFKVHKNDQWEKRVEAIANVGPCVDTPTFWAYPLTTRWGACLSNKPSAWWSCRPTEH